MHVLAPLRLPLLIPAKATHRPCCRPPASSRAEADAWLASDACSASAAWFNLWALGATSRQRLQRQLDDAGHKLRCYERQELRPTGGYLLQ